MELQAAVSKYNFCKIGPDGVLEIYADNLMLESLRKCEGYFQESILNCVSGKYRSWPLEFGIWWHFCMEYYYTRHKHLTDLSIQELCTYGIDLWLKMQMNEFQHLKPYKDLGGQLGAAALLAAYHEVFWGRERLRTVGLEIGFGKGKEVPIISEPSAKFPFRAYYTGRIDRLTDDSSIIAPLDFKTAGTFYGDENTKFKPHEGMLGYVYSTREIIKRNFPELEAQGRLCDTMRIVHISLKPTKLAYDRFKITTHNYTPLEIEAWLGRARQSFKRLYEIIIEETPALWNTSVCNNWYYHDCPYKSLHEQCPSNREMVLKQAFITIKPWNPYSDEREAEEKKRLENATVEQSA